MTIAKDLFAKNATKKKEIQSVMFDVVFVSGLEFYSLMGFECISRWFHLFMRYSQAKENNRSSF